MINTPQKVRKGHEEYLDWCTTQEHQLISFSSILRANEVQILELGGVGAGKEGINWRSNSPEMLGK